MNDQITHQQIILNERLARNLKTFREQRGFSQTELADAIGVTFQQVQKYERGTNRIPAARLFIASILLQRDMKDFFMPNDWG